MSSLCPSSTAEEGHSVHAIVIDGALVRLTEAVPIDAAWVARAAAHGEPRSRFRFASPCLGRGCMHFDGNLCTLVERLVATEAPISDGREPCAIRDGCRWFRQQGIEACRVCAGIVALP